MLDKIEYKFAKEQAEIALAGLRLSDVLQEYVDDLLKLFEQFNNEIQIAILQTTALQNNMKNVKRSRLKKKSEINEPLISSIELHVAEAEKIISKRIPSVSASLNWRLAFIEKVSDIDHQEIDNMREVILTIGENAEIEFHKLSTKLRKHLKVIAKYYSPS